METEIQNPPMVQPTETGEHYNLAPEGLKEVSMQEFTRQVFKYSIEKPCQRQVRRGGMTCDLKLFPVPNFDKLPLGYAIMDDWFDSETGKNRSERIIRFCRYGKDEDWKNFENRFAAQFAGDNS